MGATLAVGVDITGDDRGSSLGFLIGYSIRFTSSVLRIANGKILGK